MAIEGLVNRVILNDCLEVLKKLDDNSIDFVFTDPPYGHNNKNGDFLSRRKVILGRGDYQPERDNRPILNDGIGADALFQNMLSEAHRVLKPGACICSCCPGGGGPGPTFAKWSLWMDEIFIFKQQIPWMKPMGTGWHYRRSHELILIAQKAGADCKWYDKTNRVENVVRHIPKQIRQSGDHPTSKPVALAVHFMLLHTEQGDIVLDPFCGGGSTLLAAIRLNRRFIGIELDPEWHAAAEKAVQKELSQTDCFRVDLGPINSKKVQSNLFGDECKRKFHLN